MKTNIYLSFLFSDHQSWDITDNFSSWMFILSNWSLNESNHWFIIRPNGNINLPNGRSWGWQWEYLQFRNTVCLFFLDKHNNSVIQHQILIALKLFCGESKLTKTLFGWMQSNKFNSFSFNSFKSLYICEGTVKD